MYNKETQITNLQQLPFFCRRIVFIAIAKRSQCHNTRKFDKRANRTSIASKTMFSSDNGKLLEAINTFYRLDNFRLPNVTVKQSKSIKTTFSTKDSV